MTTIELNATAKDLLAVKAMIAELEAQAEALTDQIKAAMVEQGQGSSDRRRLESKLEERHQQPFQLQELQGRPR